MKTNIFLVRHGRTVFNAESRIQGQIDTELSDIGIAQAYKAKEYFKRYEFDAAYASPLSRAYRTAEIILEGRDVPVVRDDRLIEMSFGIYETKVITRDELEVLIHSDLTDCGGESAEKVGERMYEAIEEIAKSNPEKNVLIVSHGSATVAFLNKVEKDCLLKRNGKAVVTNCSLSKLTYVDDHFEIEMLSYDEYMKD